MEIAVCDDARTFRTRADPLLLENEARNNLILGVTGILLTDPRAFDRFRGWITLDEDAPVAAAIVAGANNAIISDARSEEGVRLLARSISDLPGAIGTVPWIETFVASRSGPSHRTMRQGIFALEEVAPVTEAPGRSMPATDHHAETVSAWAIEFQREALGSHHGDDDAIRRSMTDRIATQSRDFGLWVHTVDGEPVSMSAHTGPTPSGIRVSVVFTPPVHRDRGYATTLVARQSRWLLDSGHRYCFLYTDLANATSNAIYRRIGYHQIAESHEYSFNPSP